MNKVHLVSFLILVSILCLSAACQQEVFVQGKRIYEVNCENCHMADGKGLGEMYPDISQSSYFRDNKAELACLIRNGRQSEMLDNVAMPANKAITEVGMNNLINYLLFTWGDQTQSNLNELKAQLDKCP